MPVLSRVASIVAPQRLAHRRRQPPQVADRRAGGSRSSSSCRARSRGSAAAAPSGRRPRAAAAASSRSRRRTARGTGCRAGGSSRRPRAPSPCRRRCPSRRDSPRCSAQRPLPSMMMATWRGRRVDSGSSSHHSDLHDLVFFGLEHLVEPLDVLLGERLDLLGRVPPIVLGDAPCPSRAPSASRARRAGGCAPRRGYSSATLRTCLTSSRRRSSVSSRDRHADELAVVQRVQAEVGLQDRLLDRRDRRSCRTAG